MKHEKTKGANAPENSGVIVPAAVATNAKMQTALIVLQGFAVSTAAAVFETKAAELKATAIAADAELAELFASAMSEKFKENSLRGVNPVAFDKITALKARATKLKGATTANAVGLIKEIFAEYASFGAETKTKMLADFGITVEDAHKAYNDYAKLNVELPSQLADFFESASVNTLSDIEQLATMGGMQYQIETVIPETTKEDGTVIPESKSTMSVSTDAKIFGMLKTILEAEYPQLATSVVRFVKSKTVVVTQKAPKEIKLDEQGNPIEKQRERKPFDPNSPKTEPIYKIEVLGSDGAVVRTFERKFTIQDGFIDAEKKAMKADLLGFLSEIKLNLELTDSLTQLNNPLYMATWDKENNRAFYRATVKFVEGKVVPIKVTTKAGIVDGAAFTSTSGIEANSNLFDVINKIGTGEKSDRWGFIYKQGGYSLRLSVDGVVKGTSK